MKIKEERKIFITSDQHFFHKNIIRYCNRPFKSYQEMNEEMIKRWNDVVGKNDIVIYLGDFAFRNKAKDIRPKLNGIIILIRGNHDKYISKEDDIFVIEGSLKIYNLILSHEPLSKKEIPNGYINIHGHIHNKKSYNGINVSVEMTDYKPVSIDSLIVVNK